MLTHHIQKQIVTKLAFADCLKFSELQIDGIENKLFDYHLKKTISEGWVEKTELGYRLTPEGKLTGVREFQNDQNLYEQADSVLFLAIQRKSDSAWLLYKRETQPLKDQVGFMHATPVATESIHETATRVCKEKTGLEANFIVNGSGLCRFFKDKNLESFTHFTVLKATDVTGEVQENDKFAQYNWYKDITSVPQLLPNMTDIMDAMRADHFFIDLSYQLV